jgi:hypothetical protein
MSADDSDLSADDTMSQGASTPVALGHNHTFHSLARSEGSPYCKGFESDGEDVLVAARNGGDCTDFQVVS